MRIRKLMVILMALSIFGYGCIKIGAKNSDKADAGGASSGTKHLETATFAGGCFWCMTPPFEKLGGVVKVVSGYTGGHVKNPTYEQVSSGSTGHAESIQVTYDPGRISYKQLLDVFWRQIDPTDTGGEFVDRGTQYRSAIFYHNEEQKRLAEESKLKLKASGKFDKPIATEIVKATEFYPAEAYHQDFHEKDPARYESYRVHSGRDEFIKKYWGDSNPQKTGATCGNFKKPPKDVLKNKLTPLEYSVSQENDTEQAFNNAYWDNHREGIYVDVVSGEPLFSSRDKFDSGTGWPSFTKPLEPGNIIEGSDTSMGMERTEVRSKQADSHLGHVFNDGPGPTHLRYCMNSAALRFIPKESLKAEGYGEYEKLFK